MKANRKQIWRGQDRAEVGVGTLIVFIAMVLVAAVAAAVLINTSGTLQQRAQSTGDQATQQVSSNLNVNGVYGNVTSGKIKNLTLHVMLSPGAVPMDLGELQIRYSDGTNAPVTLAQKNSSAPGTAPDGTYFLTEWIRGVGSNSVMEPGDLVAIYINLDTSGLNAPLEPRTDVEVRLIPEAGAQIPADFRTPNTYGSSAYVTLR